MASPPSSPPLAILPQRPSNKRQRSGEVTDFFSSDPAPVFSSDDWQDASIEQYEAPRRKRTFRGPWWKSCKRWEPATMLTSESHVMSLARNLDSGVWIDNDDSIALSSSLSTLLNGPTTTDTSYQLTFCPDWQQKYPAPLLSQAELQAQGLVESCLEQGTQYVDMSNLGLEKLDGSIIQPIRAFSTVPMACDRDFRPQLKILLSMNSLQTLPKEIWELNHIVHLGLRQNRLETLSPNIAKLVDLQSLDITGNKIRWLPWELLSLITPSRSLAMFHVEHGNPLLMPFEGLPEFPSCIRELAIGHHQDFVQTKPETNSGHATEMQRWLCRIGETIHAGKLYGEGLSNSHCIPSKPWLVGCSEMARFSSDGTLANGSPIAPSLVPLEQRSLKAYLVDDLPQPQRISCSRVGSLFELSLRRVTALISTEQLRKYVPDLPEGPFQRALTEAEHVQADGGRTCSVCGQLYILPRAEWMEFWHVHRSGATAGINGHLLPFLRRACSWRCGYTAFCNIRSAYGRYAAKCTINSFP
ncbi:hypothetical protein EJ05DRAFT_542189 [Pseudovirgaria hyperparasitica]|uniref:Leucine rich repeat domain protein n=1 Tax=Pseudovirgaria hyperparasitica TaxID=470096 RepID=A0A6A6VTG7_9PEZI|nr:uncharacterized protein EJ05DRAFT_542189 [Pseudovirgaria hyperparasitica]KAF2753086.1 hypothetical protein EJ05DRAFT_542189 [Pseudovirgaria hyperparasitica]